MHERLLRIAVSILVAMLVGLRFAGAAEDDFLAFWSGFRQAVAENDANAVASMVRFPLEVRGPDDSDPVQRYDRSRFARILERLLEQPVYSVSGGRVGSRPMREVIENRRDVSQGDYLAPDVVRIQQFEFERIDGHWWLARAWLEE